MKILVALIATLPGASLPHFVEGTRQDAASSVHMQVLASGSPIGTSDWSQGADGAFHGNAELHLGTIVISSDVSGHFKGRHLLDASGKGKSPGGEASLTYKDGQLTVVRAGKSTTTKYAPKADTYAGNLIPGLWRTSLDAAYDQLKASRDGGEASLHVFLVDAGAELPAAIKLLPARKATVQGVAQTAKRFQITLAGVQMELDQASTGDVVAMDVPSQRIRMVATGWEGLFVDPLAAYPELSQPTFATAKNLDVRVKMRDGTALATDLIFPSAIGKYPAVLIRTPYGRATEDIEGDFYARRGYVVVSQDCRGRGESDGEWDPFVHEGDDGYDAIAWIAKQPWSNGRVGMIGGSYVGYVQWAAAVTRPPALKCIVPQVSPPDAMHNLPYDFGIPFLYGNVWWAKIVAGKDADFSSLRSPLPNVKGLSALPLSKVDKETIGKTVPFYQAWLTRTREKDWKGWDFLAHMDRADLPALHISGWWDGDGIGTKLNWAMQRHLGRKNQWLIYGPWTHAFNSSSSLGKVDFGPSAILELDSLYLRWFDTWLKGKSVGLEKVPHVRAFVTGANKWVELPDWPSAGEKAETLYLGRNSLSGTPPAAADLSYTYDPAKDTDTSTLAKGSAEVADYDGQVRLTNNKQPNLVFRSEPLKRDTAIAGPATIDLYFQTSARDTDLYGMLVDIDPSGKLFDIGQPGKIRASYLAGMNDPHALTPGRTYHVQLLPWDFAREIKKGHRIGLLIVPTLFPLYARNLGAAEPPATATNMIVQHNKLLFGKKTPSRVSFQVLWEK